MAKTDPSTKITNLGIYERGLFIQRYAGIEFSVTHLLASASQHADYAHLGELPYSVKGKLKRFETILNMAGAISADAVTLRAMHDEFVKLDAIRNFIVHGIMVGRDEDGKQILAFRLYSHIDGDPHQGVLDLSLDDLKNINSQIQPISTEFARMVARLSRMLVKPSA